MQLMTLSFPHQKYLMGILLLLAFTLGWSGTPIMAQTPPTDDGASLVNECIPSDVLFIIDQSSSMRQNDPQNARLDAVKSVVDALYLNAALACEGIVTHRIGAIGFNNSTSSILPFTSVFVEDSVAEDWLRASRQLQDRIGSATAVTGLTNVRGAFFDQPNSAQRLFNQLPRLPDDDIRQRVIILVGDGAPCDSNTDNCNSGDYVQDYLVRGSGSLATRLRNELDDNISINVLLFLGASEGVILESWGLRSAWQTITNNRDGQYADLIVDANTGARVAEFANEIVTDILRLTSTTIPCRQPFFLEPYRDSIAIVSSTRPNALALMRLTAPDGEVYDETSGQANLEVLPLDTVIRYIISNPKPGAWMIDGDPALCDNVDPSLQTTSVEAELLPLPQGMTVNLDAPYYTDDSEAYVRVKLMDRRNREPFNEVVDYPLDITGTITTPNADISLPELKFVKDTEPGVWRSITPLPAPRQGTYTVNVRAQVASINPALRGQMLDLFTLTTYADGGTPTYTPAPPVDVRIVPTVDGATFDEAQGTYIFGLNDIDANDRQVHLPISVSAQVVLAGDTDNTPLDLSQVFRNPAGTSFADNAIRVSMTGDVTDDIVLTPDPNDPTRLVGILRATREGMDVTELDPSGVYTLGFRTTTNITYNTDNYRFSGDGLQSQRVERLELAGVKLAIDAIPEQILLNTIVSEQQVNNPIPIRVRLIDQNGTQLSFITVFGSTDSSNKVQAALFSPNGAELETIDLSLDANGQTLSGSLRENVQNIDVNGLYTLRVFFADGLNLPDDKLRQYSLLTNRSAPLVKTIERIPRSGIVVETQDGLQNTTQPLNTINRAERQQIPVALRVEARLVGLDGQPYNRSAIDGFSTNPGEVISATITGVGGISRTVTLTPNNNGVYSGSVLLVTNDPTAAIDPEGAYTITYNINTDALKLGELERYEVVTGSATTTLARTELRGIELIPVEIGGQGSLTSQPASNVLSGETAATIPLYLNISEALGTPLIPGDATPQSVPFYFVLRDTNGQAINWDEIINSSLMITDEEVPVISATSSDETEDETSATPAPATRPVELNDVVLISVIDANGVIAPVTNIAESLYNGEVALTGLIDSQATLDGVYALRFMINPNVLADNVVTFSDTAAQVLFQREITSFLLNPGFWVAVELIILATLAILLLNFIYINFVSPMSGFVKLSYNDGISDVMNQFPIGGWKMFRNRTTATYPIRDGSSTQPRQAKITVFKAGTALERGASREVNKVPRYRVRMQMGNDLPRDVLINANSDKGAGAGKIRFTHNISRK